jgi:CubicO group peptidase (beta-lactamase class C family)
MRRRASLLAIAALVPCWGSAQQWSASLGSDVDAIAQEALRSGPVAGMSVAVGTSDRTLLAKGYGKADLEHDVPVTTDTLFPIQSVTKSLWAAAFLQLAERGKVTLDQEISTLLPDVPAELRHVKLRHLLSHTAGFRFDDDKGTSLTEAEWNSRLVAQHLLFAPGTNWHYSNIGLDYADHILERVSGLSEAEYFRRHITDPLGMAHSSMCHAEDIVPNRATPYAVRQGAFIHVMNPQATAYDVLCSTAGDVLRFLHALNTGTLIRPESVRFMRTPTELPDGVAIDYGLGTRIGSLHGHRMVGHTGSGDGWTAAMEFYPDDDLSVVVLTNTASSQHARVVAQHIAEKLLHLPDDQPAEVDAAALGRWAGLYDNDEPGTIETVRMEISARDGRLTAHPRDNPAMGDRTVSSLPYSGERFCVEQAPNACARFVRGKQYRWMLLYSNGFFTNAARARP